jgi:hypothetical protein
MIGQMRCCFGHAPGVAGWAHAPAFAEIGGDEVMAAVGKAGAGKAVGEDAALERQPVARDARLRLA